MAYKREELDYIAAQLLPVVLEKLGVEAQGVSEVEVVSDLTGVFSLPAYKKVGGVEKVVEAPVSLLQDIALDSVNEATENAKAATGEALQAAKETKEATADYTAVRGQVIAAGDRANAAADSVNDAKDKAKEAAAAANQAAAGANAAKDKATEAADTANAVKEATLLAKAETIEATRKANEATVEATAATADATVQADRAKELADHPTMMGENGNWWKWDATLKKYVDTGVLAKGGVLYPTFYIDPDTMELIMNYQDEIVADMFNIDNEGNLTFNPK
ncbi:hypothetical protein [uncultured Bacteroides sp.]|jgi:hypothetical protein|uniref:hypothetical protein n=1 Tax=uncultured Bacteroides sp. TaxID=162156 RepID=UPI000821E886|nr:hypothetical protein [uncultured Bacteroides sp.]SCI89029.1 Uncharacterised protein [uncultured Bacteroides sp.]DAL90818.1 MAG TPA: hypothetical protein [Caudoviricetes sp.]